MEGKCLTVCGSMLEFKVLVLVVITMAMSWIYMPVRRAKSKRMFSVRKSAQRKREDNIYDEARGTQGVCVYVRVCYPLLDSNVHDRPERVRQRPVDRSRTIEDVTVSSLAIREEDRDLNGNADCAYAPFVGMSYAPPPFRLRSRPVRPLLPSTLAVDAGYD
jgi:hypothetical protein